MSADAAACGHSCQFSLHSASSAVAMDSSVISSDCTASMPSARAAYAVRAPMHTARIPAGSAPSVACAKA